MWRFQTDRSIAKARPVKVSSVASRCAREGLPQLQIDFVLLAPPAMGGNTPFYCVNCAWHETLVIPPVSLIILVCEQG